MISLILRRLATAIPVLLAVITLTFFMVHSAPGGPFDEEKAVSPEVLIKLNERYNLNEPLMVQYFDYLGNVLQGDFGPSFRYPSRSVTELISIGLPITFELALYAILFALML
ncbi:MAG TPA: ABC transporter, partial [Gammaproteobacteria bacterium]|nr:ABC transporter [Gammaproteobacteria bacterium]